ncbi:MAG: UDP-3-O-(3-hydroxymyristoyl)glucosamine N-acyltransferase [Myxococcales bacterium]|nr:UDP-3-O-(3-hydroxymyristoyl)glucosamine N-acyltransferase [Myxococcales bacterium]|tara:strand:- start:102 stop:1160 length:1059 start_codon:yes stop_codon:yes gene_type:complete
MRLSDLAKELEGRLLGDGDLEVHAIKTLDEAKAGDLSFLTNPKYAAAAKDCQATCILVTEAFAAHHAHEMPCAVLALENPYLAFAKVLNLFHPAKKREVAISERAFVHPQAKIGEGVTIMPMAYVGEATIGPGSVIFPFAFIDDDVAVGERCSIGAGSALMPGTVLGDGVVLNPGVILGGEGFGFAPDGSANVKVPQVGGVQIGDGVEMGANACADRGAIKDTVVGQGTKIDNLVQLGHGVHLGKNNVLVAQVGVAGSTVTGDGVVVAGQSGIAGHLKIGDNVRIGAKSAVTGNVRDNQAVTGSPHMPHMDYLRSSNHIKKLDSYAKRLRAAEKQIAALQQQIQEQQNAQSV